MDEKKRAEGSKVFAAAIPICAFLVVGAANCLLHAHLLKLPYFWDEAGYFVPAARDLLLTGNPIPHSIPSNAHPPLVMAWLAASWRMFGFSPLVTRIAMLMISSLGLLGAYRLGSVLGGRVTGVAAALCVALYPVYFAQGSLAQLDMPAAAITIWGLADYLGGGRKRSAAIFTLAGLAKETAVLAPLGLIAFEAVKVLGPSRIRGRTTGPTRIPWALLCPCAALALWFAYHYWRTGVVFENTEYFRYNLSQTLNVRRAAAALVLQSWRVLGYLDLFVLTVPAAFIWFLRRGKIRLRTSPGPVLAVCLAYVVAFSWIGGAALARYMLTASSLAVILAVAIVHAGIANRWSGLLVAAAATVFGISLNVYPPYHLALDDNLAYRDFVALQADAAHVLEQTGTDEPVLTAWPATDELSHPYLGYSSRSFRVLSLSDFEPAGLVKAAGNGLFQTAFLFSLRYQPPDSVFRPGRYLRVFPFWNRLQTEFFGQRANATPEYAATLLGGEIVWREARGPLYAAIIAKKTVKGHPQLIR